MRRLIRWTIILMGTVMSFAVVQIAIHHLTSTLGIRGMCLLLCPSLGIVAFTGGVIATYKWNKFLLWIIIPVVAFFFMTTAILAFPGAWVMFFAKCGFQFAKYFIGVILFILWYLLAFYIIRPSREERLRQEETPSETELRRANEHRNPELDKQERDRQLRLIASLPEEKRSELLRRQEEYEKSQNRA